MNIKKNHIPRSAGPILLFIFLSVASGCYQWNPPVASGSLPFQNRTQTESRKGVTVTVGVPTPQETIDIYGVDLYRKKIQPVWLQVKNETDEPITLLTTSIDPEYYSPDEVAYKTKAGYGKDPQWEREIFFQKMSLPLNLPAKSMASGFVMTHVDKPTKHFYFDIFSEGELRRFSFLVDIPFRPGKYSEVNFDALYPPDQIKELSLDELKTQLAALPCCAPGKLGGHDGDPINFVIVGTREETLSAFVRAGWEETDIKEEYIAKKWDPALAKRPHEAKLHTPLYLFERPEDVGFHKSRQRNNERSQLWLWLSPWRYQGKPVWIGTVSRDIGLRYYLNKPELIITQKIDGDVDETRSYLVQDLLYVGAIQKVGWVGGVGVSTPLDPKKDSLGDYWFSDGLRTVMFISEQPVDIEDIEVLKWNDPSFQSPLPPQALADCGPNCQKPPSDPTPPPPVDDLPFRDRIKSETKDGITVSAAVPTRQETRQLFHVDLYGAGIQPVWLRVTNRSEALVSVLTTSIDPEYFSPNEAAYRSKGFFRGKTEMRRANFFENMGLHPHVPSNFSEEGFVFTHVDEGTKYLTVDLISRKNHKRYTYLIEVPGLKIDSSRVNFEKLYKPEEIKDLTLDQLRQELEKFPCCTFSKKGKLIGDPVNLVVVGTAEDALSAFIRAGWRETEIQKGQVFKTLKAYLNRAPYDYAPMSTLWLFNRPQDAGYQKPRETPHERNHFRLWLTPWRYQGQPVWIGAISRDIGLRYTVKSPFLFITHKIDSDVDETREYLLEDLMEVKAVKKAGYAKGVGEVPITDPKYNPMNDPWYSDGLRLVLFLSEEPVSIEEVETLDWELPPERNAGAIQPLGK
jgi:hypothetical protein